jgi:hypothetical protein
MHVSWFSHTWFIYNLNTFRLLVAFTQLLYTHIQIDNISYGAIPLLCSPCWFLHQFPFQSLLLTWNPSFCVVRSRPPWPQVARKLTSPSSIPPHSLPIPNSRPPRVSPNKLCAFLRWHQDPGFHGPEQEVLSKVIKVCISKFFLQHCENFTYSRTKNKSCSSKTLPLIIFSRQFLTLFVFTW